MKKMASNTRKYRGYFKVHGSSGIITVPAKLVKDSAFPIPNKSRVSVKIEGDSLVVSKLPRFSHINSSEKYVTIYDTEIDKEIDIYCCEKNLAVCDYCKSTKCEHVDYFLTVPAIVKLLKDRGWQI